MAQTAAGARKVMARKAGCSVEEYAARVAAGEKWCYRCAEWRKRIAFARDASRFDGLSAVCAACRSRHTRPGPTLRQRREAAMLGVAWCRGCKAWLTSAAVLAEGVCRPCLNAEARRRYATDPRHRAERRQHAHARKRQVAPIPADAQAHILTEFDGLCAYCNRPATTWDHIYPVHRGGRTLPGNVVPACAPCNSSKSDRDPAEWCRGKGIVPREAFFDRLALFYALPH